MQGLLLEGDKASGRFLTIRVLEESTGQRLIHAIVEHVCRTGSRGFQIPYQSKKMRQAVEEMAAVENAVQRLLQ